MVQNRKEDSVHEYWRKKGFILRGQGTTELHLQLQLEDVNVEGESYILEQVIRRTSQACQKE